MKKQIYNFLLISLCIIFYLPENYLAQNSKWDEVPENVSSMKNFKRFEWFYRQRSAPNDTIPVSRYFSEIAKAKKKALTRESTELVWENIGPDAIISTWPSHWGKSTGRIRGLAVHPQDSRVLYVGAASGGLHKSTDGGATWRNLSDDFASLTFGAIAIDPHNPDVVYAGSGEVRYNFSPRIYDGRGLYKSTDAGETWMQITSGFGTQTQFSAIDVDPFDSNNLLATIGSGNWHLGNRTNEGIWKSSDAGITWSRVYNADDGFDVKYHPDTQGIAMAGIGSLGFLVSTDGGDSWINKSNGMNQGEIARIQFDYCDAQPDIIYSHIYTGNGSKMYKTTNAGDNWFRISANKNLGGSYDGGTTWYNQGSYDLCIAVHDKNPNKVLIGNVEIHGTTDGSNFDPIRIPGGSGAWDSPMHTDYHIIVQAPSDTNVIYIGCDGGIQKSTDGGNTWFDINNGIASIQFYRIACSPADSNVIIGGAQDNGNYKTDDMGATYWDLTTTGDGMACFFDYSNPSIVYMSTQYGSLMRSTSNGDYGTYTSVSPPWTQTSNWLTPFWQHPTDPGIIYAAGRTLYKSTNAGVSWDAVATNLTSDNMNTTSQSSVDPDVMIVCGSASYTTNPDIKITTNEGATWKQVRDNIQGDRRYVSSVLCDPYNKNTFYVLRSGYGSGKLYKSTDLGDTWTDLTFNLPDVPMNDVFVDPEIPGQIFVASDIGVYRSVNGGYNWARLNGVPYVACTDFDYVKIDGTRFLRLGTYGRSAYQTRLSDPSGTFFVFGGPVGGETWVIGNVEEIQWISNDAGNLNIYYSKNDTTNWQLLASDYPSDSLNYKLMITNDLIGEIYVKVEAVSGEFSAQSLYPIVVTRMEVPELISPADGSIGLDLELTFDWSEVNGADRYGFQLAKDSLFTNIYYESDSLVGTSHNIVDLDSDADYYFRVKAINAGDETDFSEPYNFITKMLAPVLLYPQDDEENLDLDVTFRWSKIENADDYLFQLSRSSTFFTTVSEVAVTDTFYTVSGLAENKRYYWRLKTQREGNESDISEVSRFRTKTITDVSELEGVPTNFEVLQNYPNPFNPSTNIKFGLPNSGYIQVAGYNMLGEKIADIYEGNKPEGYHSVSWNAGNLSSGVYIVKINYTSAQQGNKSSSIKVMLMK